MKICTITCHNVYNHGASLQAYALMKYLIDSGYDAEIIDYRPAYLSHHYRLFHISNPAWSKNIMTKLIYYAFKMPGRLVALRRKKSFDRFTEQYLQITENRYISNEDLKLNAPDADAYICGSDQIWNSHHQNGRDPSFYLDFVPDNKLKLAYAASFATDNIASELKPMVREKVSKLDGIGVREKSGVEILEGLNIKRAVCVVDPVFLLDKNEWNQIGNLKFEGKYVLVYDFEKSAIIERIAKEIAGRRGLVIYSISPYKTNYAQKNFHQAGPRVFVSLVRNADFVISNSFHAIVFSLIFKKNMIAVNRSENLNTRIRDLLIDLKLSGRLVDENYKIKELLTDIDYDEPEKILNMKIGFSKRYLKETLSITQETKTMSISEEG